MNTRCITDLHEEIAKELLERLNRRPETALMTYGDLCRLVENKVGPRNIAGFLGDLSVWCNEIGAPMISALIYNQEKNKPGKGFYRLYSDLYDVNVRKEDEERVFVDELNKVINYKHWDNLAYYIGL